MNFITDNFDLIYGSSSSVSKLKDLVLELAIKGLLVPQEEHEEPAHVILQEILKNKNSLKSKKRKPIDKEDFPFQLPENWEICYMADIAEKLGAGSTPRGGKSVYVEKGIKFLRSQNVYNDGLRLKGIAKIPEEIHDKMSGTHVLPKDILLNITGASIGRSALVPDDFDSGNVSQHVAIIRMVNPEIRHFIHLLIISPYFQETIMDVQVGISREGLSMTNLKKFLIPLPPIPEQHRIVQKVNTLFQQIDQLAEQSGRAETTREQLRVALLHRLEQAPGRAATATAWQPLAEQFDLAIRTRKDVQALRQTILQLAVKGALVPQDPGDEPAGVLLQRIKGEKERLVKAGEIRKVKALPAVREEEVPFELPVGWVWCRGETVGDYIDPHPSHRTPPEVHGGIPYIGMKDINDNGEINFGGARKVSEKIFQEHIERYSLKNGDFIFGKIGTLGKPVFLKGPFNYALSANIILIQPKRAIILEKFLFHYLSSKTVVEILKKGSNTTTHAAFGIKKARLMPIPLPPLSEQRRIVQKVETLLRWCDALETGLERLEQAEARLVGAAMRV